MSFFDNIPTAPLTFEVATTDDTGVLSGWRETSAPSWTEPTFIGALRVTVTVVRPLARGLSAVIGGAAARNIGVTLQTEHEVRTAVDSLATDLLASAVLLDALAGDAGAQIALDHLRRRRGLPQIAWRQLVKRARSCAPGDYGAPTPVTR